MLFYLNFNEKRYNKLHIYKDQARGYFLNRLLKCIPIVREESYHCALLYVLIKNKSVNANSLSLARSNVLTRLIYGLLFARDGIFVPPEKSFKKAENNVNDTRN